jgi:hypothetical protein
MILQGNAVRSWTALGDWTMGNGGAGYLQGNAAIRQQINARILQVLGECFFDLGAGINWFGFLSSKKPAALTLAIATVVLNTPNVVGLVAPVTFKLNDKTRAYSVQWNVQTIFSKSFQGSTLVTLQNLQQEV